MAPTDATGSIEKNPFRAVASSVAANNAKRSTSVTLPHNASEALKDKFRNAPNPLARPKADSKPRQRQSLASRLRLRKITEKDQIGYFAPRTWQFWRSVIVCFCTMNIIGHLLELVYCMAMDSMFGIVADDYVVWSDPWYHPYWCYGVGAVVMTLVIEPIKEHIIMRRKTLAGALLQTFALTVFLSMALELVIGWMVNQPDEFGKYPFWDNSQLPLNIFGQAWLVNDIAIGLVAVLYVWVIFPLTCEGFSKLKPKTANIAFAAITVGFAFCCTASYLQLNL